MKVMFQTGFVWAVDALEILLLSFLVPVLENEWQLSSFSGSMIASATFLGIAFGNYFWGTISDRFEV